MPSKENRQLLLKRPELPDGFQGGVFKSSVREGLQSALSACMQLLAWCHIEMLETKDIEN